MVLLRQADRASGHGVLRAAQAQPADHFPARVPPLGYHVLLMVFPQVRARRAGRHHRPAQFAGARHHVYLLHDLRHGPRLPEVPLVEEVHDRHSTGKCSYPLFTHIT